MEPETTEPDPDPTRALTNPGHLPVTEEFQGIEGKTLDFSVDPESTLAHRSTIRLSAAREFPSIPGYEIVKELGRGAMGVVYQARQVRADRWVALKVMLHVEHAKQESIERFGIEARAIARLHHPNIVGVYEVGEFQGNPFFTLEYVEGGTLSRKIADQLLPHKQSAELMKVLAEGIEYAHSRGIIHRDLKPGNILLDENGVPKIADFGLARRTEDVSHLTQDGTIMGTPSYMSPEQAFGSRNAIGPMSDVYSLGAIMYELLAGRPPFQGASVWEVVQQVRHSDPIAPSEFQAGVPKDLETICLKCLQKEPEKRYATARALQEELQRFLNNEPILARPVGQWERLVRLSKRYPREARLIGIVSGLVLSIAIASTVAALKINADRAEISSKNEAISEQNIKLRDQRDQIQKEKSVSDERLTLYRNTVAQLVNRAPRLLESAPLGVGTRNELSTIVDRILRESADIGEVGSAKQWAIMATHLRRGETLLAQAEVAKLSNATADADGLQNAADEQFAEALRIAEDVYRSDEADRAKATSNMAIVLQRRAQSLFSKDPRTWKEIVPDHKKAIELAREAADSPEGSISESKRLEYQSNLGDSLYRYALFLLDIASQSGTPDPKFLQRAFELLQEAESLQRSVIDAPELARELKEDVRNRLALTYRAQAAAAQHQGNMQIVKTAFGNAIQEYEKLLETTGYRFAFQKNLAITANEFGDFLLAHRSEPEEIQQLYKKSLAAYESLARTPELRTLEQDGLAMQYYRLGLVAERAGKNDQAIRYFTHCVAIRNKGYLDVRSKEDPNSPLSGLRERAVLALAQARAGMEDSVVEATSVLQSLAENVDFPEHEISRAELLQSCAASLGILSEHEKLTNAEKSRAHFERAIELLNAAIDAGYSDVQYLENDPDFEWLSSSAEMSDVRARISTRARLNDSNEQ